MKTCIIFEEIPENTLFYILDGDYSHLNGVFINLVSAKKDHELCALIYDEQGDYRQESCDLQQIRDALLNPENKLIMCGVYMLGARKKG